MKKLLLLVLSITLWTNLIKPAAPADNRDVDAYTIRLLNQYNIATKSTVTDKKIQGWGLFSTLIDQAPQVLKLTEAQEQTKFTEFTISSLSSANQLLTISALNALAQLLQSNRIEKATIEQIFKTGQNPLLSHLQAIIAQQMTIAATNPHLKEVLYSFLRSYHDRFGHQAFTDFPALSSWIQTDMQPTSSQSALWDLVLLFEKLKDWIRKTTVSAAQRVQDAVREV